MGLFASRPRREFHYTPYFLKEPEKTLRERMRFRRTSGLEQRARSSRRWLILAMVAVGLMWYLFPDVVTSLWLDPVEIGTEDLYTP